MAAMASLVAGIAHEINTPIGAIVSVYDTLNRAVGKLRANLGEDSGDDPKKAKVATILQIISNAIDVIRKGSERVVAIVDSMRSFARLDEAELKSVNIQDGLDDTVSLIQHRLGDKIEVIRKYEASDPIVCYPGRLNQVFLCMLDNAIDAMEGKGTITIATRREDDQLLVAITDTGQGIPSEKLEEVFQPGYTTKGVGLGLAICHQIVHDHRGQSKVDSEPGKGSTFTTILSYSFNGIGPGH
jgi:two-component system NtrC family sensor kinase